MSHASVSPGLVLSLEFRTRKTRLELGDQLHTYSLTSNNVILRGGFGMDVQIRHWDNLKGGCCVKPTTDTGRLILLAFGVVRKCLRRHLSG